MPEGDLRLSTRSLPSGGTVVLVAGELDLSTVSALESELASAAPGRIVIDLSECAFLDSSALRALVVAHRASTEAGASFVLAAPSAAIRRVLQLASIDRVIPVTDNVDDGR